MSFCSKNTVLDPDYGYRRLDPIPEENETTMFYESQYYDLIRKGGRAPELRRLMEGGEDRKSELEWLHGGLHSDIAFELTDLAPGKKVLDVGCGSGEFVEYMQENGFDAAGIEPSVDAAQSANNRGLNVESSMLGDFASREEVKNSFDAVTILNVLEHAPDPQGMLRDLKSLLKPGGIICIRVPNDFTELQEAARVKLNVEPWWVAAPDHINYFNYESLRKFLGGFGFDVVYEQGEFPMEMFLLMGDDYVGRPELGSQCHKKREAFELGIPPELRRKIYSSFASVGIGRNCLVFGRVQG